MAYKIYCDMCGEEIKNSDRLRRVLGRFAVEIMVRVDRVWNAGHVCHKCVLRIANEGEDTDESYIKAKIEERGAA